MEIMLRILIVFAVVTAAAGGFCIGASSYDLDQTVREHGVGPLMPKVLRPV